MYCVMKDLYGILCSSLRYSLGFIILIIELELKLYHYVSLKEKRG